jgi:hypothetical protein
MQAISSFAPPKLPFSAVEPGNQKAVSSGPVAGGSGERRIFLPALSTRPYLKKKCAGILSQFNSNQERSIRALKKGTGSILLPTSPTAPAVTPYTNEEGS